MGAGTVCGIGELDVVSRTIVNDVAAHAVAPRLVDKETGLATVSHIVCPLRVFRPSRGITRRLVAYPLQVVPDVFSHHVAGTPRFIENEITAIVRTVPQYDIAATVAVEPNASAYLRKIVGNDEVIPV